MMNIMFLEYDIQDLNKIKVILKDLEISYNIFDTYINKIANNVAKEFRIKGELSGSFTEIQVSETDYIKILVDSTDKDNQQEKELFIVVSQTHRFSLEKFIRIRIENILRSNYLEGKNDDIQWNKCNQS